MTNEEIQTATTRWQQIPFGHRFMFRLVMEKPELCKRTLELLLDCEIAELEYLEPEKSFEAKLSTKGIRLDVFIKDTAGNAYDLEMQASDNDGEALGKRTRYYQSLIDMDSLKKSQLYRELKKSVVLFICKYDPYGKNLPRYTFSNQCHEDRTVALKDETYKVIVNTTGNRAGISEDLANFMDYVNTGTAKDDFTRRLDAEVVLQRNDTRKAELFMTWEQEQMEAEERGRKVGRKEGLKEGLKEGREEGRKEGETEKALTIAHNMKAEGDSLDKIMRVTGLTAEEIANA